MSKILAHVYHHVDNGGITLEIGCDEDGVYIEHGSSYFGYPSIGSRLAGSVHQIDSTLLKEFAKAFGDAAAKLDKEQNDGYFR